MDSRTRFWSDAPDIGLLKQATGMSLDQVLDHSVFDRSSVRHFHSFTADTAVSARDFRIIVADDHAIVRAGICSVLGHSPGLNVVGEAGNGAEAVRLWKELRPDLMLIDLRMPDMRGAEVISQIRSEKADAAVVVLTTSGSDEDIFRAIKAGARGYLMKDASAEELLTCIRSVCQGRTYFPQAVAAKLAARISAIALTGRELQVLRRAAAGETNKRIALNLAIAEGTVKTHIATVLSKLDAASRTEAVAIAVRRGLIEM